MYSRFITNKVKYFKPYHCFNFDWLRLIAHESINHAKKSSPSKYYNIMQEVKRITCPAGKGNQHMITSRQQLKYQMLGKKTRKEKCLLHQQGCNNFIQSILAAQRYYMAILPVDQWVLTCPPCADSAHHSLHVIRYIYIYIYLYIYIYIYIELMIQKERG